MSTVDARASVHKFETKIDRYRHALYDKLHAKNPWTSACSDTVNPTIPSLRGE